MTPGESVSTLAPVPSETKRRLEHVDAMRPLKQVGVVSTHTLIAFAPLGSVMVGASLMLLHVTREGFLFLSACMLTYSYRSLERSRYLPFYRRRLVAVGLPYLCWTAIYFFITLPSRHENALGSLGHFGFLVASGYYQLYYLLVIMQFYVLFPVLLLLCRRVRRHGWLLAGSLALQFVLVTTSHWHVLPEGFQGFWASRDVLFYQFYLLAGMVVAFHLDEFHDWLCAHAQHVVIATAVFAGVAELWFVAAKDGWASWLGSSADPFQPIVVPFNIGAIACIYLLGVYLVGSRRSTALRRMVRTGSDNAYGVYLAQMIFVAILAGIGWRSLRDTVPWPLVSIGAMIVVFAACVVVTSVLARTPLAVALTGRSQEPWSTWFPVGWRLRRPDPQLAVVTQLSPDVADGRGPKVSSSVEAMESAMSR
jgi:peptidoglycan/LPS O-acetylase OafA/YrhL